MREDGIIKFNCEWIQAPPPFEMDLTGLHRLRSKLYELGLVGVYKTGIGFGNLSIRLPGGKGFIITGSQTGGLRQLKDEHYTRVVDYSFKKNLIRCEGPVKASSESLTHAMIYEMDPAIQSVIHAHHARLWAGLKEKVPTTSAVIEYGTSAMAEEIKRLYRETDLAKKRILVMGGHEDGVITFGASSAEAGKILFDYLTTTV